MKNKKQTNKTKQKQKRKWNKNNFICVLADSFKSRIHNVSVKKNKKQIKNKQTNKTKQKQKKKNEIKITLYAC